MYADDMVLICNNPRDLLKFITIFEKVTQQWGLNISVSKTKMQSIMPQGYIEIYEHQNCVEVTEQPNKPGKIYMPDNFSSS